MFANFNPDESSLAPDPNLAGLEFHPGSHAQAFKGPVGQHVYMLITSRFGVAAIIGAVVSAPSRPPVVALEPLLLSEIGEAAFTDEMKKLTGRIVRFVVEYLGGRWVRRGIKVSVNSRYRSGSVYSFREADPAGKQFSSSARVPGELCAVDAEGNVTDENLHNEILDNPVADARFQRMAYRQAIASGTEPALAASLYLNGLSQ